MAWTKKKDLPEYKMWHLASKAQILTATAAHVLCNMLLTVGP